MLDKDKALDDCIFRIKKDNIKDRLNDLQGAIRLAHNSKCQRSHEIIQTRYDYIIIIDPAVGNSIEISSWRSDSI